jgi:hypothetical protein
LFVRRYIKSLFSPSPLSKFQQTSPSANQKNLRQVLKLFSNGFPIKSLVNTGLR